MWLRQFSTLMGLMFELQCRNIYIYCPQQHLLFTAMVLFFELHCATAFVSLFRGSGGSNAWGQSSGHVQLIFKARYTNQSTIHEAKHDTPSKYCSAQNHLLVQEVPGCNIYSCYGILQSASRVLSLRKGL
jgi:hypothetical protein